MYMRYCLVFIFVFVISIISRAEEFTDVPRELMPEPVYQLIKEILETTTYLNYNKENVIKALDETHQITRFPKYSELEYLEIFHPRANTNSYRFWGKRIQDQVVIVTSDFTSRVLLPGEYSKVIPADFQNELNQIKTKLESFRKSIADEQKTPTIPPHSNETGFSNPGRGIPRGIYRKPYEQLQLISATDEGVNGALTKKPIGGELALLFHVGYAAASTGKPDIAKMIFQYVAEQRGMPFSQQFTLLHTAYNNGIHLLQQKQNPFTEASRQWQSVLIVFPGSPYEIEIQKTLEEFQPLLDMEKNPIKIDIKSPTVSLQDKINYYIGRLPYTNGRCAFHPCSMYYSGESHALVEIGLPALPALMEHLDDTTLTTAIQDDPFGGFPTISPSKIIRVQMIARYYIQEILRLPTDLYYLFSQPRRPSPFTPAADSSSMEEAAAKKVKEWWKANQGKSLEDLRLSLLDIAPMSIRLMMLPMSSKLYIKNNNTVQIDDKKTISLLKRWLADTKKEIAALKKQPATETPTGTPFQPVIMMPESPTNNFIRLAQELENRDDASAIPEALALCRENINRNSQDLNSYQFLCVRGNAEDFKLLYTILKTEIVKSRSSRPGNAYASLFNCLKETKKPLAIPLLIPFLEDFTICRSGADQKGNYQWSYADESLEKLIALTGHNEGFDLRQPDDSRKKAIANWKTWWQNQGQNEIVKQCPDILTILKE